MPAPPAHSPPANEPSPAPSWMDAATLLLLTAGWVYLAGWAYAWRFFERLQIGLLALDIPKEYFFVYGLWVCQRWALLVVPVLLAVACLTWYRQTRPRSFWSSKAAALVVSFVLFGLAYAMGAESGRGHYAFQQQHDFPAMPRVRVWLKLSGSSDEILKRLAEELPQGCYRLALLSRSMLFALRSPAEKPAAHLAVLALPLTEVQAVRVLPLFASCRAATSP